ncbi:MAG: hypothetical protein Q9165_008433 [Trypethelium subeluteriae]
MLRTQFTRSPHSPTRNRGKQIHNKNLPPAKADLRPESTSVGPISGIAHTKTVANTSSKTADGVQQISPQIPRFSAADFQYIGESLRNESHRKRQAVYFEYLKDLAEPCGMSVSINPTLEFESEDRDQISIYSGSYRSSWEQTLGQSSRGDNAKVFQARKRVQTYSGMVMEEETSSGSEDEDWTESGNADSIGSAEDDIEAPDSQPRTRGASRREKVADMSPMRNLGPQKRQRTSNNGHLLRAITNTLLHDGPVENTIEIRDKLFSLWAEARFEIQKSGCTTFSVPDAAKAAEMCKFFFYELSSRPALDRLHSIVKQYKAEQDSFSGKGLAVRTDMVADSHSYYEPFKAFLKSVAHVQRTKPEPSNILQQLYYFHALLDERREYKRLKRLGEKKNPELINALAKVGLRTARGVRYDTLVIDYMTEVLGLKRNALKSKMSQTEGFGVLEEMFGRGIIVLLPQHSENRLHIWGKQRLTAVASQLHQHLPELRQLCSIMMENIYEPIINGEPIRFNVTLELERRNVFPVSWEESV